MSKPFKFKQFSIWQDQCAMKVGTDGVLLGCFTNPNGYTNCLDIGTGTGLLALMMAQKNRDIAVQAIEIDENAYRQAKHNIKVSNWSSRIEVANISLQQFAVLANQKFDLIISNPPYYEPVNEAKGGNLQKQTNQRKKARATGELDYNTLIQLASKLLTDEGTFNLVLPFNALNEIEMLTLKYGLFINRLVEVKSYTGNVTVRVLLEIGKNKLNKQTDTLVIYSSPTKHTPQYIDYTKDFYLGTGKYF